VEPNAVLPAVPHLTAFVLEVCKVSLASHSVRVFDELHIELSEVCVDVYALEVRIHELFHEHEV
jgi:hypothetical protein